MATFKVIGIGEDEKYVDDHARSDVVSYCTRPSKTPHHYTGSRACNVETAEMEMTVVAKAYHNDERVRLRHSVISFAEDEGIALPEAREIAETAIRYFGDQYQIIYSVHEDTDNTHIHMVMNQVSFLDGHKYYGNRKQYYGFINYMREQVKEYGIKSTPVK